jgi:hypothetical protein
MGQEFGTSSISPFTSFVRQEYNRDLFGLKGLQAYDKMRRSDGTVRGTLRLAKTPVLAARWYIKPADNSAIQKQRAQFIWDNLTEYMTISWSQMLTEALFMLEYGYYMFEKVYDERKIAGKDRVIWSKFAPRHPMDVAEWAYDRNGGPAGVWMWAPSDWNTEDGRYWIPIEKLVVFSFDKEAGNIEGMSLLRSAYKHWFYKEQLYKIDAIQKERHGIGIPIIKLPPSYSDADKKMAEELGRNLRTNERAHVVLPPFWELYFAKLEGQPVKALESIEHHDGMIRANILGEWLNATGQGSVETQTDMFMKATRFVADIVSDTLNLYCIPQLLDYNFLRTGDKYPKLVARRIGEQIDQRTQSFAVRNYVGAKILRPDDGIEAQVREELDLPPIDEATLRETETPQMPGAAGPPRQSPAAGMKQQAQGTGKSNAGDDKSGGK